MRTTIRLPSDLLASAKKTAAERGTTLTAVIEDALRASLTRRRAVPRRRAFRLPTFKGRGLRPGVDLDRTADLLDLMEAPADPR